MILQVPLFIRGPGIAPNSSAPHPTNHVDLAATIVDLASATVIGPELDGLSFAEALSSTPLPPSAWRNFSFAENADDSTTWVQLRQPLPGPELGAQTAFHWWCSNFSEVFDLVIDPWQLSNLANTTPRGIAIARYALPLALELAVCAGASCSFPKSIRMDSIDSAYSYLPCYKTNRTL